MQAVILAGGKGTRLAERLNGRPKPLIDVAGIPLMQRQLETLQSHGVDDFVVLVNHAADQIERFLTQLNAKSKISLIDDGEPRGTAGATLACLGRLSDRFIVAYGDTLFDIDIAHMVAAHEASGADATLLLHPNDHPADSDLVEIDEDNRITGFHPYPHPADLVARNLVNAAFYIVEKAALEPYALRTDLPDFAKDLFPAMVEAGAKLHGYVSFEYIKDLGTPKRLDKVEKHFVTGTVERARRRHPQKAVFLDRDGTLNKLRDYVRKPDDLDLLPNAAEAVRSLNNAEYRAVLVTNQPVLARGECDPATMRDIHAKLETELGRHGAYLDGVYLCPHHPHGGFAGEVPELKIECRCRKPATGMIDRAVSEMNISPSQSWFIGDSTGDMLAAHRAGLFSILVQSGERGEDKRWPCHPDFVVADVFVAARLITETFPLIQQGTDAIAEAVSAGDLMLVAGRSSAARRGVAAALRQALRGRGLAAVTTSAEAPNGHYAELEPGDVLIVEGEDAFRFNAPTGQPVRRIRVDMPDAPSPTEQGGAVDTADHVIRLADRFDEGIV